MTYTIHTDPAHGWLEVPVRELQELGIADQISQYSYLKGDTAYLEEDCDLYRFVQAKEKAGEQFEYVEQYAENTPIRSYNRYQA